MKTSYVVAIVLSIVPALAIPPDSFQFPESEDDTPLSVQYQVDGAAQSIQPGTLFGIDSPAQEPTVAVNESYGSLDYEYTGQYLLFLLDPDASYPENPTSRWIIHWWQQGLTKSTTEVNSTSIGGTRLVNSTDTAPRVAYRRPRPPFNSSAHRYIFYLFEEPNNFQIPEQYAGYSAQNGSRFPFEQFLDDTNLGDPVAANYFYCSNETAVPDTFIGTPGQQYPGGNGAMITEGTNNPTPTSGSPSSTATGAAVSTLPAQGAAATPENAVLVLWLALGASLALL